MINFNKSGGGSHESKSHSNLIQWVVLAILFGSMFSGSRRAILPMLIGAGRFLTPFVIIWLVFKMIKSKISRAFSKLQEQMMQGVQNGSAGNVGASFGAARQGRQEAASGGQVLDLCPKCGSLLTSHHQCDKKG